MVRVHGAHPLADGRARLGHALHDLGRELLHLDVRLDLVDHRLRDVLAVVVEQRIQKLGGVGEQLLGVVPVLGDLLALAVGVCHHLGLLLKHDAGRLHDELDARGRIGQCLDNHHLVAREVLQAGERRVQRGERLVQVTLRAVRNLLRRRRLLIGLRLLLLHHRLGLVCILLVLLDLHHHVRHLLARFGEHRLQLLQLCLHHLHLVRRAEQLAEANLQAALGRADLLALLANQRDEGGQ
mmetsp:Transcript_3424/g.8507  ORF Transcript_3424/g.8507 Transcript_3424/m.8507 type:complete len:239 (-) Transcript_3424:228-944(-)